MHVKYEFEHNHCSLVVEEITILLLVVMFYPPPTTRPVTSDEH